MLDNFQSVGTDPEDRERLNKAESWGATELADILSSLRRHMQRVREGRSKKEFNKSHLFCTDSAVTGPLLRCRDTLPIRSKGVVGKPEFPGSKNKR